VRPNLFKEGEYSMKRLAVVVTTLLLIISMTVVSYAGEDKKQEAEDMVKKAVAYVKEVGKEKAFAEFNNKKGKFTVKDRYIFVIDMKGVTLANGQYPEYTGKSRAEIKDENQNIAVSEILKAVKKSGKGWASYQIRNPVTKKIEKKQSYVEKFNDIIIGCGIYVK
jgi:methyl-accepting chemotaxis protein